MALAEASALAPGIRGAIGNAVFVRSPYGTQIRSRPDPANPRTPAQVAARERMQKAGYAWRSMTLEQAQNWRNYAAAQNPAGPNARACAQQIFTQLAVRFLQVNPHDPVPLNPPSSPFLGDAVTPQVEGTASGIRVTADRPNTLGTVTEILLQPLESIHRRTYESKYRSAKIDDFSGSLEAEFGVLSPAVGVAVRFIRSGTGQATELFELGVVLVLG